MSNALLALDPSSTAIGWAHMTLTGRLIGGGIIRPESQGTAYERIVYMNSALLTLLEYVKPPTILVEWTAGKVAGRLKSRARGAGLAIYGIGVGAATMTCHWYTHKRFEIEIVNIVAIAENYWTRGVPKKERQAAISLQHTEYKASRDPGGDLADAIGLAQWWLQERKLRGIEDV